MGYTVSGSGAGAKVTVNPDIDIKSSDNSVDVSSALENDKKTYDLKVTPAVDTSVSSTDGSVSVNEDAEHNFNLSVSQYVSGQIADKQDKLNLVTESENGIARMLDKKLLDKSFLNSVAVGEGETYADADAASAALIQESGGFYYPITGSTMHWINQSNKLILSRFYREVGISGSSNTPYRWIGAAYQDGVFVLSAQSNNNTGVGSLVIAKSLTGKSWTVSTVNETTESWRAVMVGGGNFVVMTGNRSQEYMYSSDGEEWTQGASLADKYWVGLKYMNGKWTAIGKDISAASETYYMATFGNGIAQNPTESTITLSERRNVHDFCFLADKYYLVCTGGCVILNTDLTSAFVPLSGSYRHADIVNGNVVLSGPTAVAVLSDGETFVEYNLPFTASTQIVYSGGRYMMGSASDNAMWQTADFVTWVKKMMPSGVDNSWNCIINAGDDVLLLSGPQNIYTDGSRSDTAYLISSSNMYVKNLGTWVDMPVLDSAFNGLLSVKNRDFQVLSLSDYLNLTNNILSTVHFDRYTAYANYPATSLDPTAAYQTVFIPCALSSIVDGTTAAYSDEACTTSVGTITAHGYNLNNPDEIAISIAGTSCVYLFVNSKYPCGLASMKALIDGLEGLQDKADRTELTAHTGNADIHVTAEDKAAWNDALGVQISDNETVEDKTWSSSKIASEIPTTVAELTDSSSYAKTTEIAKNGTPVGCIFPFAGTDLPAGYLLCNGTSYKKTDYPDLYAVIGNKYGGDTENFKVPNLIDKFIQGSTTSGTAKAAGLPNITGETRYISEGCIWSGEPSGAFNKYAANTSIEINNVALSGSKHYGYYFSFDASRCSTIYGNSNTVQPPALTMVYIIKAKYIYA